MSETTAAPAAPAAAPPPADAIAPPASSQPGISVTEAARLLRQQRQANGATPPAPAAPERKPPPSELAREAAQKPAEAPAPAEAPKPAATGLSAMERALGVPGDGVAPPPAAPSPEAASVEIEGQRYSQAQLREAVLKAGDYTQKTQALAQERAQLQAQQQALAQVLPYIQPELQRLAEAVQRADAARMPDPALAHSDPTAYVQQRAAYDAALAEAQRLGSLTTLQQQAQQRAMEQQVAAANEALAKEYPFWADPKERLAAQQELVEWATTEGGFSRDELRGLADARHLKLMMKAAQFDKWVKQATRTQAPQQVLAAPARGAPLPPAPAAQIQQAQTAFEQRPNIRSATALLSARRATGR